MTQAAVSYQIKVLEDRLGGPLFLRGARGVSLTEAGRRIAPAVADAFGQLRMAFESLQADGGGVLAITAVNTFATYWLVPRLGEFQLAHPGIAVRLDTSPTMWISRGRTWTSASAPARAIGPAWPSTS